MRITNSNGLPQAFLNFARSDKYSKGDAHYSATGLIDSPRIAALMGKHSDTLTEDVADRVFAMLGSAFHHIAEMGAGFEHETEQRLFHTYAVGNTHFTVSGQLDMVEIRDGGKVRIIDFKVTSVWAVQGGSNPVQSKWAQQLGVYKDLYSKAKGIHRGLIQTYVCVVFRDWKRAEVDNKRDYPRFPAMMIRIKTGHIGEAYIKRRIVLHEQARADAREGNAIDHCTPEERWTRHGVWAVMRGDNKKASKLFEKEAEASEFIRTNKFNIKGVSNKYKVVKREDVHTRCEHFCPVRKLCDQVKAERVLEFLEETHGKIGTED